MPTRRTTTTTTTSSSAAAASASDTTWSVKEVFDGLKSDILHRLDKQDAVLETIDRRLGSMATKEDVHQIHERIDGVEARLDARLGPLEQAAANEQAVAQNRSRFRSNLAWAAGIAGTAAIVASVVVPFLVH